MVDAVSTSISSPNPENGLSEVVFLIILLGVVAVANTGCSILRGFIGSGQAQAVTDHMASMLHAKSVNIDLEYYEDPQCGLSGFFQISLHGS